MPEDSTYDCVPACICMAARYYKTNKMVDLPHKISHWGPFFDKLRITSPRGTNVNLLKNAIEKMTPENKIGLKLKVIFCQHVADLIPLFELEKPIPIIVVYDKGMVHNRVVGGNHASLLHTVDVTKETVKVVDPAAHNRSDPSTMGMDDFLAGWNVTGNQAIIPYPSNMRSPINVKLKKEELYLTRFGEVSK